MAKLTSYFKVVYKELSQKLFLSNSRWKLYSNLLGNHPQIVFSIKTEGFL